MCVFFFADLYYGLRRTVEDVGCRRKRLKIWKKKTVSGLYRDGSVVVRPTAVLDTDVDVGICAGCSVV